MVDRHETKEAKALMVVDLDGTYVKCNTLRRYVLIGLKHCLRCGRLLSVSKIVILLVLRRLRLISHKTMKFSSLEIIPRDEDFINEFAKNIQGAINYEVRALIDTYRHNGGVVLLATAAPDFYVPLIWDGDFVATDSCNNPKHIECRGKEKLNRVLDFAENYGYRINTVITDHTDDAPLFQYNKDGFNILVNPTKKTLRFFRELEPTHFLLIKEIDKFCITS